MPVKPTPDFDSIAEAWQKWEEILEPCFLRLNELLLRKVAISASHDVLDLGCGSGNPALLIAKRVTGGKVIGIDISEPMLSVARRKAKDLHLTNVSFQNQDVDSLPFETASFDSATARFSLMFVQNPQTTITEVFRVLRKGGRFSVCVWGDPERNPLPRKVIGQYCELPFNDPEAPGPYRFAERGRLAALMEECGFVETGEEEMEIQEVFQSGEEYVQHLVEASALWGSMLRKLNPEQFGNVSDHLVQEAERYRAKGQIFIPRFARIVYAMKPLS